jgi:hypothetical protein
MDSIPGKEQTYLMALDVFAAPPENICMAIEDYLKN